MIKGIFGVVIILSVIFTMLMGQSIYEIDQETDIKRDIYNFTENALVWNFPEASYIIERNVSDMTKIDISQLQSRWFSNVIYKGMDFVGYSVMEIGKWSIEFGYAHPQYDFQFFSDIFIYYIWAMVLIAAFPILIPAIVLIYLSMVGLVRLYKILCGIFIPEEKK